MGLSNCSCEEKKWIKLCVDFRKLNAITKKDTFPLPDISTLSESFSSAKMFSTLDLLKAFNQVKMDNSSQEKVTLICSFGTYSYTVMPFGITNGPATFSRAVFFAYNQLICNDFLRVYIDDMTCYTKDFESHLQCLKKIFEKTRIEVGFRLNPEKCMLFRDEIGVIRFYRIK